MSNHNDEKLKQAVKATGGFAFPGINAEMTGIDSDGQERWDTESSGGMTLRDYFAAKAMQGLLSNAHMGDSDLHSDAHDWLKDISEASYEFADAMLKERAK